MFTSVHASAGALIMVLFPNEFGLLAAFLSHHFLDYLGERNPYGRGIKNEYITMAVADGLGLSGTLALATILTGNWWAFGGIVAANLMDLIDKPLFFFAGGRQIFPCHGPKSITLKALTATETMWWNAISFSFAFLVIVATAL